MCIGKAQAVTFVITQPCIDTMDQSCVEVCPVDCIHFEEGADRMLYINPAECIDCGACQPACPVSAIFPEADVPAEQKQFIPWNTAWYDDPAATRTAVAAIPAGAGAGDAPRPAAASTPTATPATSGAATATPTAEAAPAAAVHEAMGAYKYGEGGIEGKCALCGQYVTKGGVKFRTKSVLCPECSERQERIGDPFQQNAGRR